MASKFAFTLAIAKYMSLDEVGLYGLVAATLSFSVTFAGGEFYTYCQREMLGKDIVEWRFVLLKQFLALVLIYLIVLPFHATLFIFDVLPAAVCGWFFLLLVFEHLSQECNRILVIMNKQILATAILFLRLGAWVWVVLGFMAFGGARSLNLIFACWLAGSVSALLLGGYFILRSLPSGGGGDKAYLIRSWNDRTWFIRGYSVAARFLITTLSFKALVTLDKILIERLEGVSFLGVYVVYFSLAMAVNAVLTPTIFSFLYPKLIAAYRQSRISEYASVMREMTLSVFLLGGSVAFGIYLVAPFLFDWVGKPEYLSALPVLSALLVMSFLYNVGMIPHYALYARGDDNGILIAQMLSLLFFLITCLFLFEYLDAFYLSVALIGAVFLGNMFKLYRWWSAKD